MQVKKLLDAYPMEISEQAAKEINLENVLSNTEFI
jgi:phosphatidylinositol-4,5-bisphosphate 3-kinase